MSAIRTIQNHMRNVLGTPTRANPNRTPLEGFAPYVTPDPEDGLSVYALMRGPEETPYAGGVYLMLVKCPEDFPMSAPVVKVFTPSGRFEPGKSLCVEGVTHMHAEAWVPKQLVQLLSSMRLFMSAECEGSMSGMGGIQASEEERRMLAAESWTWCVFDREVCRLFPEFVAAEWPAVRARLQAEHDAADCPPEQRERLAGMLAGPAAQLRQQREKLLAGDDARGRALAAQIDDIVRSLGRAQLTETV